MIGCETTLKAKMETSVKIGPAIVDKISDDEVGEELPSDEEELMLKIAKGIRLLDVSVS